MTQEQITKEAEELLRKCLNANKDDTEPEATSSEWQEPALTNKLRNEIKKFLSAIASTAIEGRRENGLTDFEIMSYLTTTGDNNDIAMCPDFIEGENTKRGDKITMGAAAGTISKIAIGEWQPVLYLFNKKKFFEIKKAGVLPSSLHEGER